MLQLQSKLARYRYPIHRSLTESWIPHLLSFSDSSSTKKINDGKRNTEVRSVLSHILENQRKFRKRQAPYGYEQRLQEDLQQKTVPRQTLFDVFPVPAKSARKPNAFAEEPFLAYESTILGIIEKPEFRKMHKRKPISEEQALPVVQWLTSDVPVVEIDLPTFSEAVRGGRQPDATSDPDKVAVKELYEQKGKFMETMGFSKEQYGMLAGSLFKMANILARNGNGLPMSVLWEKIKEAGISDKEIMHNVLYIAATFPTRESSSRAKRKSKYSHLTGMVTILDMLDVSESQTSDEDLAEENLPDLVDEIAIYHDLIHKPTEQSINIRVKLLVLQGKAQHADNILLEQSKRTGKLHLRVFRPVLRLHLELGDSVSALNLFGRMLNLPSVILDAETYMYLLHGLARNGKFRADEDPLQGLSDDRFSSLCGQALFGEIVTIMSKEIIDIPDNMAKLLRSGLSESFPDWIDDSSSPLSPLPLSIKRKKDATVLADRVVIPNDSGICPVSGVNLRLIQLSDGERLDLIEKLLYLSKVTYQQFIKNKKQGKNFEKKSPDEHLKGFYEWLDQRKGLPFTTIVDGANVGYYQQNFQGGRFSFHQIKFIVDSLQRLGENPLVILPLKYSRQSFIVSDQAAGTSTGQKQTLGETEQGIQRTLLQRNCVYFVPSTFLDDFYWILASVSLQSNSRQGRDLSINPGSPDGRWPGSRPVLITNDQMRDHQVEMLEPMLFRRWYSNCIVNYNFFPFVKERQSSDEVGFCPADFFSREIQANKDETGTTVWHFPLQGKENEWFCVKLPGK